MKNISYMTISAIFVVLIFMSSSVLATEGAPPSSGKARIDYLDNGTLYDYNIHHKRPAKAIPETFESRREKSIVENLSFSVYSNFPSRYVYQAMASSDGFVWQPSATIELYGVGFNVWGNFVLADIPDQGKFNEVDLTLYYNVKIWGLTIHPYMLFCLYPTDNKRSLDYSAYTDIKPSLHLAYSLGPIDIFTELAVYLHPNKGALILDMGLGFQHEIVKNFGIETSALIGLGNSRFNRSNFNVSETKINHFAYSLGFPWNAVKGLLIKPNANVSAFFSQKLRNAVPYPVLVWGGVDLSYNF
ncbi:MAG: hypothetical protein ABH871_02290 [Pseudomonadota bacterium]